MRHEIYRMFPKDYSRYIEVFGGGGWVLFGKPQNACAMEVYNDFNNNLSNLFLCTRDKPISLIKELGFLPLNSRNEFFVLTQALVKTPQNHFSVDVTMGFVVLNHDGKFIA